MRQSVDQASADMQRKWGAGYTFAEGIGQVAVGLLGAGKITAAVTGLKVAGETMGAVAAWEPHAANFANLANSIPGLSNPLTAALASKPGDSDAMGYAKNTLTSLGMSAATVGTFMATTAMLRAVNSGDKLAVEAASKDLETALDAHQAEQDKWTAAQGSNTSSSSRDTGGPPPSSSSSGSAPSSSTAPSSSSSTGASSEQTTTSATATPATPGPGAPGFTIPDDQFNNFMASSKADQEALIKYGSRDAAIAAGHTFAPTEHIPWQLISSGDGGIDAFIARAADTFKADADTLKGGAVQTDAATKAAVDARAQLWGQDPAALRGMLQQAQDAPTLRANMQAGFLVANSIMQDSYTLAARIGAGDTTEFGGSVVAATAAVKERVQLAAKTFSSANSILANAARTVRGAAGQFRYDPAAIQSLAGMDPNALVEMLKNTEGNPRMLAKVVQPTLWQKATEGAQLLLVNDLISNPETHVAIFAGNLWQLTSRPLERMAGSVAPKLWGQPGTWDTVGMQAAKSYTYMMSSIPDALKAAQRAWKMGDSIIAPHDVQAALDAGTGGAPAASGLGQMIAQAQYGPWNNVGDILKNIGVALAKTGTIPTRMVGFQDELVKQVSYRSNVQGDAWAEGHLQGLKGDDLTKFVKDKLDSSFDDYGRATNMKALQEAKVATFQNDLNATGWGGMATQGAKIQQFMQNNPPARIVLPFVRTPVNLFRQGVQLTPGLNMAQQEYNYAIRGLNGPVAQAQAVGQMGMGALIMGTIGTLAYAGHITGDAPSDPKLASESMQDGWRPNSIVWQNADGSKTYIPFERYDPVMMPFAMAANIVSVMKLFEQGGIANENKAQSLFDAMAVGLLKQLTNRMYLQNLTNTIDAVSDPDRHLSKIAGTMAGNYVPMSSLLHLTDQAVLDPVMREADGFISAFIQKLPGFSSSLPPRRDWSGDPIGAHPGLWLSSPDSRANAEVQRLALEQGGSIGPPTSKAAGGSDLRGITLAGDRDPSAAGRSAYDRMQELAGHPERMPGAAPGTASMRNTVAQLINSENYRNAPDGASTTPGTKLALLTSVIDPLREGARQFVGGDKNVMQAEQAEERRVASLRGGQNPGAPTVTNATDSFLQRLGSSFGLSSLRAPSPATPTGAGGPQQ
jgi:hypothetical protein